MAGPSGPEQQGGTPVTDPIIAERLGRLVGAAKDAMEAGELHGPFGIARYLPDFRVWQGVVVELPPDGITGPDAHTRVALETAGLGPEGQAFSVIDLFRVFPGRKMQAFPQTIGDHGLSDGLADFAARFALLPDAQPSLTRQQVSEAWGLLTRVKTDLIHQIGSRILMEA